MVSAGSIFIEKFFFGVLLWWWSGLCGDWDVIVVRHSDDFT